MNNYTVYMHISPNNKRYIGITRQKEKERWQNGKGYEHNKYFTNAIEKYGWNNFQHIIIARGLDEETAKWLEIELIREWDTSDRDKGYNLTKGGESSNGLVHTEEWKQEHSKRMSGENNPNFGKKSPMYGKQHSEESKKKMSNFQKGKKCNGENPMAKKVICLETNEVFDTVKQAYENIGGSESGILDALQNKRQYMNFSFVYYEDYINNKEIKVKKDKRKEIGGNSPSAKKVICLETMEIFGCIKEASEKINCDASYLSKRIKNKKKYKGYTFMLYEDYILSMEM